MMPAPETAKRWGARLLLAFVFLSIGFALGKDVTLRRLRAAAPALPLATQDTMPVGGSAAQAQAIVYYMHGTIRCITCNQIERLARQTVAGDFAAELAAGRVVWREVNFDQDPVLAKKYDVASSTLVVVRLEHGQETAFKRLDDVWTLAEKPAAFTAYVTAGIRGMLATEGGK